MTVPARLTATEAQEQARETLGRAIQLAALYTSELRGAKHAEWLRDIHLAALAVLVGAAERTSELDGHEGGETCRDCGRPVVIHSGSFWNADNDLWNEVWGDEGGILCQPCFVTRAKAMGIYVSWKAVVYHRQALAADRKER